MKLGDLLSVAGNSPLDHSSYSWSNAVLEVINNVVPTTKRLTETSTASEALQAIQALSAEDEVKLLALEVDPVSGTIVAGAPPVAASSIFSGNPKQVLALAAGGAIVIVALMLAATSTLTAAKAGQNPDTGLVSQLLSTLLDLVKALMGPSNPTPN